MTAVSGLLLVAAVVQTPKGAISSGDGAAGTPLSRSKPRRWRCCPRDLGRLPHLLRLSRRAMRAIRQNLAFSLGVLAVAVGLTIAGVLHPASGALLHELSSIPVIANSARLIGLRE